MLHAEVVLEDIRRAQMGIDKVHATTAEWQETGVGEIDVARRRLGRKRVDGIS